MIAALLLLVFWIVLIKQGLRQRRWIIGWVAQAVRPVLAEVRSQVGSEERLAQVSQAPEVCGYVLGLVWERGRNAGLSDLQPQMFVQLAGRAFRRIWGAEVGAAMGAALEEAISEHPILLRRALRQGRLDARRLLLGEEKLRAFSDLFPRSSARSEIRELSVRKQIQWREEEGTDPHLIPSPPVASPEPRVKRREEPSTSHSGGERCPAVRAGAGN